MPLYAYKCSDCKNIFEEFHPMKDADKKQDCPECGGDSPRYYKNGAPNFYFVDRPGANIIDKSPMKDFNKGMPDDIRV